MSEPGPAGTAAPPLPRSASSCAGWWPPPGPGPAPAGCRGPACPPVGTLQHRPHPGPPMPTPADDLAQQLAAVRAYCPSPGPGRAPGPPICPTPAAGCGGWGVVRGSKP